MSRSAHTLQSAPLLLAPVKDAARAMRLDFEIRYVKCALAPKAFESHPMLQLFLGAQFERDRESGGIVNVALNEDNLGLVYTGSLMGTLKREHREIPAACAIGIDSYAIHLNDFGHSCYVNVGTSYALLQDVMRDVHIKGSYEREHALTMHTVVVTGNEPIEKGVISLRIKQVEVGPSLTAAVTSFIRAPAPMLLQSNPAAVANTINAYIDSTVALEQALKDTVLNTERMHAFMDISETGAQMLPGGSNTFLPIAAFAMIETPRANEGYFLNAYERVMARRGMTLGAWHDFDVKEKARTMALMLCMGVQTFDYVGDAVEMSSRLERITQRRHVGNEEFSDIWNALCGDCEDGGRGIASVYKAFIATPLVHPDLVEMQAYAREYVPLCTLSVVHGAKIGDQEGFGAHMYLPLLPRTDFIAGLLRTPSGAALVERLAPAVPLIGAAGAGGAGTGGGETLPRLFCEGTGRIDPLGYRDPIIDQRRYVAINMPSLTGYKKEIPREEGAPSTFYHANLLGITDQFVEQNGVPIAGFVFCQVNAGGELSRGHLFTDMVRGTPNLAILPHPPVPPTIMSMIGEAIALRPPARPLEFDARKANAPKSNTHLDKLVAGIKALKHEAPRTPPAAAVQVVMRPHQISAGAVQQILYEAARCERVYDASYELEYVTTDVHHYLLHLWVK